MVGLWFVHLAFLFQLVDLVFGFRGVHPLFLGAPVDVIVERAEEQGMDASKAEHEIDKLKQKGEVYEPKTDHLRTT